MSGWLATKSDFTEYSTRPTNSCRHLLQQDLVWQEGLWCSCQCWSASILEKVYSREGQNSRCLEWQSLQSDSPGWEQRCVWGITSWWAWPRPDSEQGKYESLYSSPMVCQLPNILPSAQSQSLSSDASDESSTDSEELPTVEIHLPGRRNRPSSESDDDAEPVLKWHTTRDTAGVPPNRYGEPLPQEWY